MQPSSGFSEDRPQHKNYVIEVAMFTRILFSLSLLVQYIRENKNPLKQHNFKSCSLLHTIVNLVNTNFTIFHIPEFYVMSNYFMTINNDIKQQYSRISICVWDGIIYIVVDVALFCLTGCLYTIINYTNNSNVYIVFSAQDAF